MAHTAICATELEESPQERGQAGETGSPTMIQMDERESHLIESSDQQTSLSAGCTPMLCCLWGHSVLFSCSLLF